jgi:hypothetical protein
MIASADHPKECTLELDNYIECLHHKKEVDDLGITDSENEGGTDTTGVG